MSNLDVYLCWVWQWARSRWCCPAGSGRLSGRPCFQPQLMKKCTQTAAAGPHNTESCRYFSEGAPPRHTEHVHLNWMLCECVNRWLQMKQTGNGWVETPSGKRKVWKKEKKRYIKDVHACFPPSVFTVSRARPSLSALQEMLRTWEGVARCVGWMDGRKGREIDWFKKQTNKQTTFLGWRYIWLYWSIVVLIVFFIFGKMGATKEQHELNALSDVLQTSHKTNDIHEHPLRGFATYFMKIAPTQSS